MSVTLNDVEHIARLAKLSFGDEEKKSFTEQFNQILAYVETLNELDTEDVAPTTHIGDQIDGLRTDKIRSGLSRDEALKNAPRVHGGFFSVPKVIGPSDAS